MTASVAVALGKLFLLSGLILGLAHVATFALGRRSAALRHLIWVVAFGLLLIVPPAAFWLPKVEIGPAPPAWVTGSLAAALDRADESPERESPAGPRSVSERFRSRPEEPMSGAVGGGPGWIPTVGVVYALVAGALIARLLASLVTLRARLSRLQDVLDEATRALVDDLAALAGVRRTILLRKDVRPGTPWTWGAMRPVIVLPPGFDTWRVAQQRNALVHEIAHIRRLDFLAALLAQLCLAFYWFQPLAWSAERARRREAEYSSDDIVVALGASPPDYANQLLGIARIMRSLARPGAVAAAMSGRPGQFLPRVNRILDTKARRTAMKRSTRLLTVGAGVLLAAPLVFLEPQTAVSQDELTASDVQRVLVSGPRTEAELDAALEFLIETHQNDRARALLVDWLSAPEDAFVGCDLCWRLIDRQENSPPTAAKRAVLMAAFGDVESAAQRRASPNLLMRLVGVLLHAETASAEDLGTYYLLRARTFGELSDSQKLVAMNFLQKVGHYDAALRLVEEVNEDPDSSFYRSQDTRRWIAFIESKQSRMSQMEERLSGAEARTSATYEYLPAYKQQPAYPAEAAARQVEGDVVVRYTVTSSGQTKDPVVVESTDSVFDQSAIESVATYRYLPRVMNGVPVDVPGVQVRILYRLE